MTTMTQESKPDDDTAAERWLAVLAGKAPPTDADTAQAAEARQFFEAQLEAQPSRLANPQRLAELMDLMRAEDERRAREAAAAPQPQPMRPTALEALWRVVRAALLPPAPSAMAWRLGGLAAGVLGVAVLVGRLPGVSDPAEAPQLKSLPPAATEATPPRSLEPNTAQGARSSSVLLLRAADPVRSAVALQQALKRLEVEAQVFPLGTSARLEASVPAPQVEAVQAELSQLNLNWAGGANLVVVFEAP